MYFVSTVFNFLNTAVFVSVEFKFFRLQFLCIQIFFELQFIKPSPKRATFLPPNSCKVYALTNMESINIMI